MEFGIGKSKSERQSGGGCEDEVESGEQVGGKIFLQALRRGAGVVSR
ncbi:hypothetical protein [Xanthomonas oryzae]|nr:hypothetical protein [Xanthomonas oryzae]